MSATFVDERSLRPGAVPINAPAYNSSIRACECDGSPGPLVAKIYAKRPGADEVGRLRAQIEWRNGLPKADRQQLDARVCWPVRIIRRDGLDVGILLPRAPRAMFTHGGGGKAIRPFRLNNLVSEVQAAKTGLPFRPLPDRLALLGSMVRTILWLHDRRVIVGDVSGANVLAEVDGTAVMLVDADSMSGPWGRAEPMYQPIIRQALGSHGDMPDARNDLFIAGWLTIWVLTGYHGLSSYPDVLDPYLKKDVRRVLRAAVSGDRNGAADRAVWDSIARLWPRCLTNLGAYLPTDGGLVPWDGHTPIVDPTAALDRVRVASAPSTGRARPTPSRPQRSFAPLKIVGALLLLYTLLNWLEVI